MREEPFEFGVKNYPINRLGYIFIYPYFVFIKLQSYERLNFEIAGSNPARGMDVCLRVSLLCCLVCR
jgi:hypothetical protein